MLILRFEVGRATRNWAGRASKLVEASHEPAEETAAVAHVQPGGCTGHALTSLGSRLAAARPLSRALGGTRGLSVALPKCTTRSLDTRRRPTQVAGATRRAVPTPARAARLRVLAAQLNLEV